MFKLFVFHIIIFSLFYKADAAELRKRGFFTQASVLYWQAEQEGLSYAVESASVENIAGRARAISPSFDWDFGFNIGMGYRVPHDSWQLLLQFTSFQTHCDAQKIAHDGYFFFPVWLSFAADRMFATQVKAHWRLHLGLVDLLLSKPFYETKTLVLNPQIGIRFGSARQKFNLEYGGGTFFPEKGILIRMKNKYCGIGPYAGLAGEYAIAKGFGLLASGGLSLLYGEFYLHQDEDTLQEKQKLLGLHSIDRASSLIMEGSAGIRWQHLFSGCLNRLTLDLSFDQLLFFSQNQLLRFVDHSQPGIAVSNQGDLAIAGIHFQAAFDF